MSKHPAAFINAIAEEGTKAEAVEWLQKTWDENCELRAVNEQMLAALQCALFDLEHTYSHVNSVTADRIKSETIPLARAAIAKAEGDKP